MSGIFGICTARSRRIDMQLQKMAVSISHRGPDGTQVILRKRVGFGHTMLKTTVESENEKLPYIDPESGCIITTDARIDNRSDLANQLGIRDQTHIPDSIFILLAYKKWGLDAFAHLVGDFAVTIWDPIQMQLVCARDYIGVKPYYYYFNKDIFLFSSEIKQLVEYDDVPVYVNKVIVAEYLTHSMCSKTETLYRDINRLAPGHCLVYRQGRIAINQFWSWVRGNKIWYKNLDDYSDHFQEIFARAVQCRLRTRDTICAELSGGLDSSSTVAMAAGLLQQQGGSPLKTFSMIFPGCDFDESEFIAAAVKNNYVSQCYVDSRDLDFSGYEKQVGFTHELPDPPNLTMNNPLIGAVKKQDCRIILTGIGGDEFFFGSGYPYLNFLKKKQFEAIWKELRYHCKNDFRHGLKRMVVNVGWPLVPIALRKILLGRGARRAVPSWLAPEFVEDTAIMSRILESDFRISLLDLGEYMHSCIICNSREQYALETVDRRRAFQHIEVRHPFLDQRICEFALSVPDCMHQRQGDIKLLLRGGRRKYLPRLIRERRGKADFSYIANRAFQQTLFHLNTLEMPLVKMGWIDGENLSIAIREKMNAVAADGYTSGRKGWELWFAFSVNMWYKLLNGR